MPMIPVQGEEEGMRGYIGANEFHHSPRTRLMQSSSAARERVDGLTQHPDISLNRDLCRAIGSYERHEAEDGRNCTSTPLYPFYSPVIVEANVT